MVGSKLGKYERRAKLGHGAMGSVYEAWDPAIARRVAIKTIRLPAEDDTEANDMLARFRAEAQSAGRLSHPGVVTVFDYGEAEGVAYIVMEFIEGRSLQALLDAGERLTVSETLRIMRQLLASLQYTHDHGVIHRDIKPSNIMLTPEGQVKITDFGIARIENSRLTRAGTVLGTPAYMSPEQFTGEPVDHRTDIYSAGVMVYQLLTGDQPFGGSSTAIMHKVLNTRPPKPSALSAATPPGLDRVIERAMARRPRDRFQSATAFADALQDAARGLPKSAPAEPDAEATIVMAATDRSAGLRRQSILLGGALAGLLVLAAAWGAGQGWWSPKPAFRSVDAIRHAVREAAAAVPCAFVAGDVAEGGQVLLLRGLVEVSEEQRLHAMLAAVAPSATLQWQVVSFAGPYCGAVALLRTLSPGFGEPASDLVLATVDGRTQLQEGDPVALRITAPAFRSRVQLDYLQSDGVVFHMQPSAGYPADLYEPGSEHAWGDPRPGVAKLPSVQPPFGDDLILAISAATPLLSTPRPEEERADSYLAALQSAVEAARARSEPLAAASLVLVTRPRR